MSIVFSFPEYDQLAKKICLSLNLPHGDATIRHFPDAESYVKLDSSVEGQEVILVCGLDNPDTKAMALMFFVETARELGAARVGLVTPYLSYMRQDQRFKEGEAVTSRIFADFVSHYYDWMVTIDPHLHRYKELEDIYAIPCDVIHACPAIAEWIQSNVKNPLLVGPDEESAQWVEKVAAKAEAPFTILEKTRKGDRDVEVTVPQVEKYQDHTPVLVDDIISTGRTMLETIKHLEASGLPPPVCIGIHAVFADDSYELLKGAPIDRLVTCNSIPHPSNAIDLTDLLANAIVEITS